MHCISNWQQSLENFLKETLDLLTSKAVKSSKSTEIVCTGCWPTPTNLGCTFITVCMKVILTSGGLSKWLQRTWQTSLSWTLFTWWRNVTLSQLQLLPSVYQCIWQGVDIHEVLKSRPAFLESHGMLGGCQPIMLPFSCEVTGCKVALLKYGELINH